MSTDKIRFFLEENKVFFETAAALALSVMSILVSYFQYQSSQKQNDLSEKMLKISLEQIQPSINVSATYLDNDGDQKYDEERLIVTNKGNPIYSPNIRTIVLVEAQAYGTQNGKETLWKDIFFTRDFYAGFVNMQNIDNVIFKSLSYGNNDRLYALSSDFSEEAKKIGMFGSLSLRRYVLIEYQDLADKAHSKYYILSPVSGSDKISKKAWGEVHDFVNTNHQKEISIAETSGRQLLELIMRRN